MLQSYKTLSKDSCHNARCNLLESMINERDQMLLESSNQFELLKEDFKYNLNLLEARDNELQRLEEYIRQRNEYINSLENDIKTLKNKYETLEIKHNETIDKFNQEQSNHKAILHEVRSVVESMKWAASEEDKAKAIEIKNLKDEIRRLTILREESLDSQRKDLTDTFEHLIQQKENQFILKENLISKQVLELDNKFDKLTTENIRLKSVVSDLQRSLETKIDEISNKDEQIRKLQYKIDDERNQYHIKEDDILRKYNQLQFDYNQLKDKTNLSNHDYIIEVDKLKKELEKEKKAFILIEKSIDELNNVYGNKINQLENLINELRQNETQLHNDVDNLNKDKSNITNNLIKYQIDNNILNEKIILLNDKIYNIQITNENLLNDINKYKNIENDLINQFNQLKSENNIKIIDNNIKYTTILNEKNNIENLLNNKTNEFENLKNENSQLNKNLEILTNQINELKKQFYNNQNNYNQLYNNNNYDNDYDKDKRNIDSPIFSEDYGSVSIPEILSMNSSPNKPRISKTPDRINKTKQYDNVIHPLSNSKLSNHNNDNNNNIEDHFNHDLQKENEQLKQIVKQMRSDMEALQTETYETNHHKDLTNNNTLRVNQLEKRLELMAGEIARLRKERLKLMDVGNELRSALHKQMALDTQINGDISNDFIKAHDVNVNDENYRLRFKSSNGNNIQSPININSKRQSDNDSNDEDFNIIDDLVKPRASTESMKFGLSNKLKIKGTNITSRTKQPTTRKVMNYNKAKLEEENNRQYN